VRASGCGGCGRCGGGSGGLWSGLGAALGLVAVLEILGIILVQMI